MKKKSIPRRLMLLLIILLTIYAPLELSRLILAYHYYNGVQFYIELGLMWVYYIIGMMLVWRLTK